MIEKRFPADTTLEYDTFLNNKNIDGELYAYLMSYTVSDQEPYTYIPVGTLPTQSEICKILGFKSPKTLRNHLKILVDEGYVEVNEIGEYYFPHKEDIYFNIPLDTINLIKDSCKEHVYKVYIYLGQRYKYAQTLGRKYTFTVKELAEHLGMNVSTNKRAYEIVNNALRTLQMLGLVDFSSVKVDGFITTNVLTGYSLVVSDRKSDG